ncbi:hypothetical protein [Nocardia sp. BMG51109]|uniref:hypothetical protein n=1 Tax=Nocardia sp. BMG51109 TaxID=1056816 RepID=UPI0004B4D800|nr:hypothetical protein [Nocardia sp. BMG51109]
MRTDAPRLGIDFGRVIQGAALEPGAADTVFLSGGLDEAMRTPPSPGAFEVLARLLPRFDGAWIISKCGPRVELRTRQWLDHHDLFAHTGLPRDHLRFCRARADKAIHCAELGITHMIDDRLEVHSALRGLVPHLFWFGVQTGPAPDWVRHTRTWPDVEDAVSATLSDVVPPTQRDVVSPTQRDVVPPTQRDVVPPTQRDVVPPTQRDVVSPTQGGDAPRP